MTRKFNPNGRLVEPFSYQQNTPLPITTPIAMYIRQSTTEQIKHHKQSIILQDQEMYKRLITLGWTETLIYKLDADTGTSGTKFIVDRADMQKLYTMIGRGEVGAVACYDPSRLFRDHTYTQSSMFVEICHQHAIPVLTWTRIYWTGQREDKEMLFVNLMAAAKDLQSFIDRTRPAKLQAIEEGISYGGHSIPMGYIIHETPDRKYYVVYEPHAKLIRYLYKRYRELSGNLSKLRHELEDTGFLFPLFTGVEKIPHVGLDMTPNGYPIKTRGALVSILTNPAYLGWYVYNSIVISKEAHEPIVALDDFLYAYDRLSPTTLDGEVNTHKPPVNRTYGTKRTALLEGLLTSNGNKVYANKRGEYEVQKVTSMWHTTEFLIDTKHLDAAILKAIVLVLELLELRHRQGLQDSLHQQLEALSEEKTEETNTLVTSLENINKQIAGYELDKQSCRDTGNKQGLDEANRQLKRLYDTRDMLKEKQAHAKTEQADIQECLSLHEEALNRLQKMSFEKQNAIFICYSNL